MKLESLEEKQTNSPLNEKDPPGQFIGYPESKVERQSAYKEPARIHR
ncbi:MAG: hypothetical protein WAK17_25805 [Candidatus Nitrosopolaris sp.]